MKVTANALFKRVSYFTLAFVLAVSTLTAAVPFILSEKASAISIALANVVVDSAFTGTPGAIGDSGKPTYGNIPAAAAAAAVGSTIVVKDGTYNDPTPGASTLTIPKAKALKLSAENTHGAIITVPVVIKNTGGYGFDGFVIRDLVNDYGLWVDGTDTPTLETRITNNKILNISSEVKEVKGIFLGENAKTYSNVIVSSNEINNISSLSKLTSGIFTNGTGKNISISNNTVSNSKVGINTFGLLVGSSASVTNNTLYDNVLLPLRISSYTTASGNITTLPDTTAPAAPLNGQPGVTNTNDFYFTWDAVTDGGSPIVEYQFQSSTSDTTSGGSLVGAWQNWVVGNPGQQFLATPTIHSTGAGDGQYYWQVRAIDQAGNVGAWSAVWSTKIDSVAPTVSWQKQPNVTYKTGEGFHVRPITGEEGLTKAVYIDSVTPANLVWSLTSEHKNFDTTNGNNQELWDSLSDGTHKFIAVFTDAAGNATEVPSNNFVLDRTAPTVKVNLNRAAFLANGGTAGKNQVPEIEALDTNLTRIEVWKSGSKVTEWTNVAQGVTTRKKIDWLGEGTYTVRAFDAAGNVSSDFTLTIDNTAPVAPQSYNPSNGGWNTNNLTTFVWKNVADADRYEIRYSSFTNRIPNVNNGQLSGADATNFSVTKSAGDYSNYTATSPLADGNWFWQVRAIDAYGNVGTWGNIWSTKIDTTPPSAPVVINANVFVKIGQVNKDLAWAESQSGVVKYEYREYTSYSAAVADSAYWQKTINAPALSTSDTASLTSTVLYWRVVAIDAAGNRSGLSDIGTITIDRNAPSSTNDLGTLIRGEVSTTQTVSDNFTPASGKLRIWKLNDAGEQDPTKFFSLGDFAVNGDNQVVYTFNTATQLHGDGQYIAEFTATDKAGNQSVDQKHFTVDNTAPVVTSTIYSPSAPTNGDVLVTITLSEEVAEAPAEWTAVDGTNTVFEKLYTANVPNGDVVAFTDVAGNPGQTIVTITWIDKTAPIITSAIESGSTVRGVVGFTVNDADATVRVNGVITTASQVSGDGTYTVIATDAVGNVSNSLTFTINNAQTITFNAIDLETATPLITGTALWVVDPASVESVIVTIDGNPYAATIDADGNWSVQVIEPLTDGEHTLVVNGVTTTFTTTLPTTFNAPAIVSPAAAVLGDATQNTPEQNNGSNETGIQGANTERNLAAADTDENKGILFGLAWYWWILILAALTALAWWIIGAIRRRREEQN